MSEETTEAGLVVPRAMLWSYFLNGALGVIFLVTFLFCITDLEAALELDYPFLFVFQDAFSLSAVNALSALVIVLVFAGTVASNLSTSQQTWAFARDNGMPFSHWAAQVHSKQHVPVNAVVLTCVITVLLSLINIGSDVAFNAIISLNLVALMASYSMSIGCLLWRRLAQPLSLPPARWSLGSYGVVINASSLVYSLFAVFWCFWPSITAVTLETFNWAVVMFIGVVILSGVYYVLHGRRMYKGPVVLVEGWPARYRQ